MPLRQELETARFEAKATDGSVHVVVEFTTYIQMMTFAGPAGWVPEGKAYRLPDGGPLEALADGAFRIVGTGMTVRRDG